MSNKIANSILSAIDIVVDKKISEASFDRTVIATVVKPISSMANNKYQVRYQDSLLEALVPNDAVYRAGDSVFLLMPQNKLEEQNWILGTALSSRVSETKEELIDANYTIISTITDNTEDIFSTTANMARKEIVLWSAEGQYNKISIDADAFASNAKRADTLLVSAEFQASVADTVLNGNYGLEIWVKFDNLATQKYILDTGSMVGNYFNFTKFTKQIQAFTLYSEDAALERIVFFTEGFSSPTDIQVQNIEVTVAKEKDVVIGKDILVNILTPSGTTFYTDTESIVKGLYTEAQLRKHNELILSGVEYYWFIENPQILAGDDKYLSYGGQGWELLNSVENGVIDYFNRGYSVKIDQVPAAERRFKVVVIFEGKAYIQELIFYNNTSDKTRIHIIKNDLTLNCIVDPADKHYTYQWYTLDPSGTPERLQEAVSATYTIPLIDGIIKPEIYRCAVYLIDNNGNQVFQGTSDIQVESNEDNLIDILIEYAYGDSSTIPPYGDDITVGTNLRGKKIYLSTVRYDVPNIQDHTIYLKVGDYELYMSEYWQASSPDGSWGFNSGETGTQNIGGNMQGEANTIHVSDSAYIEEGTEFVFPDDKDYIVEVYNSKFVNLGYAGKIEALVNTNLKGKTINISTKDSREVESETIYFNINNGEYVLYVDDNSYWQGISPNWVWGNNGGDEGTLNEGGNYNDNNTIHVMDSAFIREGTQYTFPNDKDYIVTVYDNSALIVTLEGNVNNGYSVEWSEIMPPAIEGKSLWQRTTKYYADGRVEISYLCLSIGTPKIVDGNWWVGEFDTGVKAEGPKGESVLPAVISETVRVYISTQYTDTPIAPSAPGQNSLGQWTETIPTLSSYPYQVWSCDGTRTKTPSWKDENTKTEVIWTIEYPNWGAVELYNAFLNASVNGANYVTYLKLTNFGTAQGIKQDENGNYYINATYINSGTLTVGDLFTADLTNKTVTIGGFTVKGNSLYTNEKTSYNGAIDGVYVGNDGIGLGAGSFYITNKGYLYSISGSIGGWTIGTKMLYNGIVSGMARDGIGSLSATQYTGDGSTTEYIPEYGYLRFYAGGKKEYLGSNNDTAMEGSGKKSRAFNKIANWYITNKGFMYVENAYIKGHIEAESGTIAGLTIGKLNNNLALYHLSDSTQPLQTNGDFILCPYGAMLDDFGGDSTESICFGTHSFKVGSDGAVSCRSISINSINGIFPYSDGVTMKGNWYLGSSPLTTSDADKKNSIQEIPIIYTTLFDNLSPTIYKYNNGTSNRYHVGFIAQNVKDAIEIAGLTTQDFAGYAEVEDNGQTDCYLRYEEFIALNTMQIQALKARVKELEEQIQKLLT